MFAKLKEKTSTVNAQKSPLPNSSKAKVGNEDDSRHLHSIHETSVTPADSHHSSADGVPSISVAGRISRQSSVSSLASEMSMISTSQFVNDSPMPNIDLELGSFDVEDTALPVLSSDLSPQDVYSSLVRESRQKLNFAKFKFQDLMTAYRELEKQNLKVKDALAKSQDRAFKKIAELKENEKLVRLELDKCQQRIASLEQEVLNGQQNSEQSEADTLREKLKELDSKLDAVMSEESANKSLREQLSAQVASLQNDNARLEEGVRLAAEKAMDLKKSLTEKDTIHSLALAECKRNFHNLLEERDLELKNCRLQMDNARSETIETRKQVDELTNVLASVKAENSALRTSIEKTEKRLEAEKLQLVQEVSKAKDAACEALLADFDRRMEDLCQNWERDYEKKMQEKVQETDASWQRRMAEYEEQSKMALEESWLAKKAAVSKHEQELEVVQARMSQLSTELDSARMTLHRRTVEADQLRSAQSQLSMQSTADIEQAVSQCRREMETDHRAEIKKIREEYEAKICKLEEAPVSVPLPAERADVGTNCSEPSESYESPQTIDQNTQESDIADVWSRVKGEISEVDPGQMPEVSSISDIIDFLLLHSRKLAQIRANGDVSVRAECEKAFEERAHEAKQSLEAEIQSLKKINDDLSEKLAEQSKETQHIEAKLKETMHSLDEMQALRSNNESLQEQITNQTSQIKLLENQLRETNTDKNHETEILEAKLEEAVQSLNEMQALRASNETLQKQIADQTSQIKSLESQLQLANAGKEQETQIIQAKLKEAMESLQEVKSLRSTNDSLQQQLADQVSKIKSLENQLSLSNADKEQLSSLQTVNDTLNGRIEEQAVQIQALTDRCQQNKVQLDNQKAESDSQAKKLASILPKSVFDGNKLNFAEIVASVLKHHGAISSQLDSLNHEKSELLHSVDIMKSELEKGENEKREISNREGQRIASLTKELEDCQAELASEMKRYSELKKSLEASEAGNVTRLADLEESLRQASNNAHSLQQKLASAQAELDGERSTLATATANHQKLVTELETLRTKHKHALAESAQREKHLVEERNRAGEDLKASSIDLRRLETKLSALENELAESRAANEAADGRYDEEIRQTKKTNEDFKGKIATLEMDLVECRQKMALSQELVGKLKTELDSSRKVTEDAQQRFATLKTQSAKKLKGIGDEKCELEKQLASSMAEIESLKTALSSAKTESISQEGPTVDELEATISALKDQMHSMSKAVTEKQIRISELELELSSAASRTSSEIDKVKEEHESELIETEQRIRLELKRVVADFEKQLADKERQILKLTVAESARESRGDPERQLRNMERELSEKNAAVEQLVVMYEKQLRDQASELRQEATTRMQSQNEKHQAEIDGLMNEFRNETKQWVLERQNMADEIEHCRHDREQMVHELKRLSDLLDSARNSASPSQNGSGQHNGQFATPSGPGHSSIMAGSSSPGIGAGGGALQLHEATEYEYLRNILLEYMLGRETNVLWRVIGTVMRFSDDQMQEIANREDTKSHRWL